MVGKLLSFWDGIFSGAMLNFQGVDGFIYCCFCGLMSSVLSLWCIGAGAPTPADGVRRHSSRHIRQLMEEILHQLGCIEPCEYWDKHG